MWKPKQMRMHLMSTVVTIADEAFAMMLLMNNWERWVAKAKNDGKENDKNLPTTRWTMVTEEDRSRMFCGWSLDALDVEWPKMWAKVKKDREANKAWEHEFRDKKKKEFQKSGKKARKEVKERRSVVVYTGFDDAANVPLPLARGDSDTDNGMDCQSVPENDE